MNILPMARVYAGHTYRTFINPNLEDVKIGGRKYPIVEGDGNYGAEKIDKDEKIVVGQNQIDVEGEVDTDMPGEYVVKFSMTLDAGHQEIVTGMRRLYVIVRDN